MEAARRRSSHGGGKRLLPCKVTCRSACAASWRASTATGRTACAPCRAWNRSCRPCRKRARTALCSRTRASVSRSWWRAFPSCRRIGDRFVSAFYRLLKPSHEIYERFLSEYGLKAEECVFLDDLQENVDGAIACGIRAHRFTTVPDAAAFLSESLGVNLS